MKVAKKKKVSKKNKSSWRKHVDITDVDNFLESSRLEERIGTFKDVADSQLFQVDKTPSKKSQKESAKEKRRQNAARPLKCLQALENTSKVGDPLKARTKRKNLKNMVTMKHATRKPKTEEAAQKEKQEIAFDHDLWSSEEPYIGNEKVKDELDTNWLSKKVVDHHLRNTGTANFRVPKTARRITSKLKAFEPPHPGMSYNPKREDHVQLLEGVVSTEEDLLKKEAHLNRVTKEMFSKMSPEERERQLLQEMSAGLGFDVEIKQEDEIKKEFSEDESYATVNPPVERKPKSKKALRKKAEEIEKKNLLRKAKMDKKKNSDIVQIGKLKQSIVKKEMKLANKRNKEDKEEAEKEFKPRRLGPLAFKEVDLDVAYPGELTGSLRTTKSHGNILKDRYVSLEKRNMVAPSKRQGVRKRHKVKSYIKNTHKGVLEKPINAYKPQIEENLVKNNCMKMRESSAPVSLLILNFFLVISATNHWLLTKEGKIQPQVDSPYFLRRPDDLIAFLNQSKHQQQVDTLYAELLHIKTDLRMKINHVDSYTVDFMYQTKCIVQYFLQESDLLNSVTTRSYLSRLYKPDVDSLTFVEGGIPKCRDFLELPFSLMCFEHLDGMYNRKNLSMNVEQTLLLLGLELSNPHLGNMLVTKLRRDPYAWRYHTLASLYWRSKGNALEALECARRGVYLAPRQFKDIALLSLGTILQRSRKHADAVIVLGAAVDHAPTAENHMALANSLVLISEFNRSVVHYEAARSLDASLSDKVTHIRNSMVCFKYIKKRLLKIAAILDEMSEKLKLYDERKKLLEESLEKLLQEQAPLASRGNQQRDEGNDLHQRGQYCSTRYPAGSSEPVLFCDFVSDIQMKLETGDLSVDLIVTYLEHANELIHTHMRTIGVFEQLNVDNIGDDDIESLFNGTELLPPTDSPAAIPSTGGSP
uniref:Ribosome biogenesis protein NOP53 n=1 Tax=Lutzomyia longipalpis TaxID=7200 RepID=A0A7G3AW24_LUTLO